MQITEKLAKFISETKSEEIPADAITNAKNALLDSVGVALAGSTEPASKIITACVRELGGSAFAGVVRGGFRTSAPNAALANGTITHCLDYDDSGASGMGHASAVLMPTVLAVGEQQRASGREIIDAYIIGFELWHRVASVMPGLHLKGWHPTGVFGTMGAAAAAARLMKLDTTRTMMALGLAGSEAAGIVENFGTMAKPFHAGNAARSGVLAAMLTRADFTATKQVFEGGLGFPTAFYRGVEVDLDRLAYLGDSFVIANGIDIKKYSCCYSSHSAIDAALYLANTYGFWADDVEAVDCQTGTRNFRLLSYIDPTSSLEGKFSMQFCVASAILERHVGLAQFTNEKVNNPATKMLMRKITKSHLPESLEKQPLGDYSAVVTVKLKDGREYTRMVKKARGHSGEPLNHEEIVAKYRECAAVALEDNAVIRSLTLLENFQELKNVNELADILVGPRTA